MKKQKSKLVLPKGFSELRVRVYCGYIKGDKEEDIERYIYIIY